MSEPSLSTRVRRVLDAAGVTRAETVLVACSGGLDSQVLLDVFAHLAARGRVRVVAHGVDHGLRAEAADELARAAALAADRGVPFGTTRADVTRGGNLQARARRARYEALRAASRDVGASRVATAHHLDDRAETVLLRILRGAPLASLAVLPAQAGDLLRPLVGARRAELEAHARRRGIEWADDPSNRDPRYVRVRVRREILPLLRALDPRVDEHLVRLADDAARIPADPVVDQLVHTLGASSARAHDALRAAGLSQNPRARVLLRGGAVARWDRVGGFVINTPSHGRVGGRRLASDPQAPKETPVEPT